MDENKTIGKNRYTISNIYNNLTHTISLTPTIKMKQESEIHISIIFLWVAIAILIVLLAWWAFGSSPTKEDLGFGITIFGVVLTWASTYAFANTIRSLREDHTLQTKLLKDIRGKLK